MFARDLYSFFLTDRWQTEHSENKKRSQRRKPNSRRKEKKKKSTFSVYLTDLEQLLSAAKVPGQMQEKRVLTLSICLTVAAEIE